jgi:SAM-dependent methyltransferase
MAGGGGMQKSTTDQFWNKRAAEVTDQSKVNIDDTVQRDFELRFILEQLSPSMRMLEVGCGNGYVTDQLRQHVAFVDAFDYAENMIERARDRYGETNNRFFHDSVLDPKQARGPYDVILCVRVLINLRNLTEQVQAVSNLGELLRPGGRLILIEGYREGFDELNGLRTAIGLPPAHPAAINYYSRLSDLMPHILSSFAVEATFNTGVFDFLTRVVYPVLEGPENAAGPGEFHKKVEPIIHNVRGGELARYARLFGFSLGKREKPMSAS